MRKRVVLLVSIGLLACFAGAVRGDTVLWYGFDGMLGADIPDGFLDETNTYWATIIPGDAGSSIVYAEPNPVANTGGTSAEFTPVGDGHTFGIPDACGIDFSAFTAFTVELFINPAEPGSGNRRIWSEFIYAYMYLDADNALHAMRKWDAGGGWESFTTRLTVADINDDEWVHIACTWDSAAVGNRFKLYVDGAEEANAVGNSTLTVNAVGAFTIGGYQRDDGSVAQYFYGKIDEFRLSDEALDPSEFLLHGGGALKAKSPNPSANTEDVCPDATITWVPGEQADKHDVYLGTDFNDVRDANTANQLGVYRGRQDPNSYTPGGLLSLGEVYYWRIDEVNSTSSDVWPGSVWVFSTNNGDAFGPDPADEGTRVPLDADLVWQAGCDANQRTLYFSTDFNDVNDRVGGTELVGVTTWDPPDFNFSTVYYWRVDESNGVTTWPGDVWSFTAMSRIIDVNMVAWYKLDETDGNTAIDSSGYDQHADVDGPDEGPDWNANDGRWGGSLGFADNTDIECPGGPYGVLGDINDGISVSVWLRNAYRVGSDNWVFGTGTGDSLVEAAVVEDANGEVYFRAGNDSNDVITWDLDGANPRTIQGWHHWVFVKNEDPCEVSIYFDGFVVESNSVVDSTLAAVASRQLRFGVGHGHGNDFLGRIDDIRVFKKGLSAGEVATLFRGGEVELAWAPDPFDGEQEVRIDANLSWKPGDYAEKHDVYLGTDFDDVNSADTSSLTVYEGRQDACEYDPVTNLQMNATYYWRIDEVNIVDPNVWKGNIWALRVANFIIIDDFEDYDTVTNKIFNTWEDGNVNLTGSFLDLGSEPFDPVHIGIKSMLYVYDNFIKWDGSHHWSEVALPFSPAKDFTEAGVKVLTLYFYGTADNDADDTEELYVGLEGSLAEVRYSDDHGNDNNDIRLEEWTEWNIAISEFGGVDPCAVTGLLIGFGDRDNTDKVGGEGVVYFDDVRLNRPRCLPEFLKPAADLNNDCIVSWGDIDVIGSQWLRSDANVAPVQNPGDVNLVGHWELDGDATDSSANAYHGTAEGTYDWISGKIGPGAIDLSGGWVVVEDEGNTPKLRPKNKVSLTTWIRLDTSPETSTRIVIRGRNDVETYAAEVGGDDKFVFFVRDSNGAVRYPVTSDNALALNEWVHVAGTYDNNEITAYINGQVEDTNTLGAMELIADSNDGLGIGGRYGDENLRFQGGFDDVRVYDRALSRAEVAWLASQGTGEVLLDSVANLFTGESPEVINIRDAAVLLETWLEERLWPE